MSTTLAHRAPARCDALASMRRASSRHASTAPRRARGRVSARDSDDAFNTFVPRRRRSKRTLGDDDDDVHSARTSERCREDDDDDDDGVGIIDDDALVASLRPVYEDERALADAKAAARERDAAAYRARQAARDARIEACTHVIVVEGGADIRAVRIKANVSKASAKVVAIRHRGAFARANTGEMDVKSERMDEIERLSVKYAAPIVVLFDADSAGRQLRNAFLKRFPLAEHAFMGAHKSSAKVDGTWHAVGNVGVEHAEGEDILQAIARARVACVDRHEFTRESLATWGLVAEDANADVWAPFGGVVNRRRLVGEYLGVGDCDARQLLRQMNLFFTADEVREALDALPGRGEPIPPKMTDGFADRARRRHKDDNQDDDDDDDNDYEAFKSALGFDPMAYTPPGQAPPGFE